MAYDLTRPNSGRMIDYWMGGEHNFEIDRQAADQIAKYFPVMPEIAIVARKLVRRAVEWCYARGIRAFLDFGAALPTCDNTHLVAQEIDPSIKVVYSDIDPITVAYSQELLQGNPNVVYLECDAARPQTVLESPLTQALLGSERRVGILYLSLAHFIPDAELHASWQTLYDWVAPDSYMICLTTCPEWLTNPALVATSKLFAQSNVLVYHRSKEQVLELLSPWQLTEEGIAVNATWGLKDIPPPPIQVSYSMMLYKPK